MPHINEIKNSKFLKKEDVGEGVIVTITDCTEENTAKEGSTPEMKWALHFRELEKPMVLNSTNAQIIAKITGKDDTDDWIGARVELYSDPSISFGGKLVGGIRVRAVRGQGTRPPQGNLPPGGPFLSFDDAVTECMLAGITRDELVDKLKQAGRKGWQPSRDTAFVRDLIARAKAAQEQSFDSQGDSDEIPF